MPQKQCNNRRPTSVEKGVRGCVKMITVAISARFAGLSENDHTGANRPTAQNLGWISQPGMLYDARGDIDNCREVIRIPFNFCALCRDARRKRHG